MQDSINNKKQGEIKVKRKRWRKDDTELTLLALPTCIWYFLFCYMPMFGVIIAFKNYRITPGKSFLYNLLHSEWVGFKNFEFLVRSNDIWILLRNTICYNLVFIILGTVIPVSLAIAISQLYSKRKAKVYQTMMFFPHFMSWVVVAYFTYSFLSVDNGLLNGILGALGKEPIQWYMEKAYWPFILVFMAMWKSVGYSMVVYLASITGIDATLYEAAVIDGANKKQQIRYITLPCLKTVIIMMLILKVGGIFYSDFGLFYQISQGAKGSIFSVTATLDTFVYSALKSSTPIGMTAAASLFQSVACCITILTANWLVKKVDRDSAII
ncbi:MAG: ABC transporter permease [Acetivibrio ethanolgignens]